MVPTRPQRMRSPRHLIPLRGEDHGDRQTEAIAPRVDPGGEATSRAAKTFARSARFMDSGGMLVGAHDGQVDHLHAVLAFAALVEVRQYHIPNARRRPAPELAVDRAPLAEMIV